MSSRTIGWASSGEYSSMIHAGLSLPLLQQPFIDIVMLLLGMYWSSNPNLNVVGI